MWWLVAFAVAATPSGGAVRAQLSEGGRCDRALADSLKRSRAVELVNTSAELHVALHEAADGFTLELQRPSGERLLLRKLAPNPECRDVAFAIVVILERFLRGIDLRAPPTAPTPPDAGTPRRQAPPPPAPPIIDAGMAEPVLDAGTPEPPDAGAPEPDPIDAGAPPPPREPVRPTPPPPPPPPAPLVTRLELAASGGIDFATTAHGLIAIDAALFLSNVRLGLLGHGSTPDSTPVTIAGVERGRLDTQSFGALATAGYCRGPALRVCGLLHAGARIVRGSTSGDFLFQSTTVWLVRPAFALEAQLGWLPVRALLLYLSLAGALTPAPAEFTVQGVPDATRRLPIFEGQLRLGVGLGVDR